MQYWARAFLQDFLKQESESRQVALRIIELLEAQEDYLFRSSELQELAMDVSECVDLESVSALLAEAAKICGMDFATVCLLRQGDSVGFRSRVITTYPPAWIERYQNMNYQYFDPVLAQAKVSSEPFLFSDLTNSGPLVCSFWSDAEAHGVGPAGLCASFEFSDAVSVAVSYSSMANEKDFQRIVELNGTDALCMAFVFADAFVHLSKVVPFESESLTGEELRYLSQLVSCKGVQPYKVTARAEHNPQLEKSIVSKLNVETILQAIALASANRWFDDVPYHVSSTVTVPTSRS